MFNILNGIPYGDWIISVGLISLLNGIPYSYDLAKLFL